MDKKTKNKDAIKIYSKQCLIDPQLRNTVKNEINILKQIDNENVMKLYEVIDTQSNLYLVLEYINGINLLEIIKNEKWLGERRYTVWSYRLSENESEFQSFLLAYRLYQKSKKLGIDVSGMIEICQMIYSSFSYYLTCGKTDKEETKKRIMFAHQMIENPDESYEEIVEFKF